MFHLETKSDSRLGSAKAGILATAAGIFLFIYLLIGWSTSPWIIAMDRAFFDLFEALTQRSWALDTLITKIFTTDSLKTMPLLACVVWLFLERQRQGKSVSFFPQIVLGSLLAMTLARITQNLSSHRPRPLHNPDLAYDLPLGMDTTILEGWSSFPSDTTALAFSIAAGLLLASRRLGIAAVIWCIVVVAFPRAYGGLHYPSDLLGGALIGLICTMSIAPLLLRVANTHCRMPMGDRWTSLIGTIAFLYLLQIGSMFNDIRAYGSFVKAVLGF